MDEEKLRWVAFSVFPGIGPVRFRLLLDYFGTARSAYNAPRQELVHIGLSPKLVDEFIAFRTSFDDQLYIKQLEKEHVWVIAKNEEKYPRLLANISDPPFVLYGKGVRGPRPIQLTRTIAIVGTRSMTPYGKRVTQDLVSKLTEYGCTIVSGLALGIDAVAHETALECAGQTIAVLGCGVDIVAPPANSPLYARIISEGRGAVLSEMPLSHRPSKGLFPARNRIISGLSLGVVVTEGADDSGALITARYAADQGREVFAVPGPITSSYSKAPAILLKNGATFVDSVEDILSVLGISTAGRSKTSDAVIGQTPEEDMVIGCLKEHPQSADEIVQTTHLLVQEVSAILTILELRGIVKDYGEKEYGLI